MKYCQLQLTCADKAKADKVANALLVKHLIACAKVVPVSSTYWWQGKIESANEALLIMDSKPELFDQIETEIAKLHSYETFVLQQTLLDKVSEEATKWLAKELR